MAIAMECDQNFISHGSILGYFRRHTLSGTRSVPFSALVDYKSSSSAILHIGRATAASHEQSYKASASEFDQGPSSIFCLTPTTVSTFGLSYDAGAMFVVQALTSHSNLPT
jgi:hypothetical protein